MITNWIITLKVAETPLWDFVMGISKFKSGITATFKVMNQFVSIKLPTE